MDPQIISTGENEDGVYSFEILNVDVSVVNSLRRTLMTHIKMLVFRGFPHSENNLIFHKNKSKFNNEYLKQRIECIPIHESNEKNFQSIVDNYAIRLKVVNNDSSMRTCTTNDFEIISKSTGNSIKDSKTLVERLFPQDRISKGYVPICVLMPKISDTDEPEEIDATFYFSIGEVFDIERNYRNECWNAVSKCAYFNKPDDKRVQAELVKKPENEKRDFELLDSQRLYFPNQFVFKMQSIGVYTNSKLITKASNYLIERFRDIIYYLSNKSSIGTEEEYSFEKLPFSLYKSTKINTMYEMHINHDDYTIGKLIENHMHLMFVKDIYYISFKKDHPHSSLCKIEFTYRNEVTEEVVIQNIKEICEVIISIYEKIIGYISKNE
jgi:DNA-directed RNA polymerase subunit L